MSFPYPIFVSPTQAAGWHLAPTWLWHHRFSSSLLPSSSVFFPSPAKLCRLGLLLLRALRGPSPLQPLPPPPRLAWPPNCAIRAPLKVPRAFFRPPLFVAPEHKVTSLLQGPTAESGRLNNLLRHWRILHMLRIQLINYSKVEQIGSSI